MKHTLKGYYETKTVYLDGELLGIGLSHHVRNYSPEFDWGNKSTGASQLSLAILLALTGSHSGHSKFKYEVLAGLPQTNFDIEFDLDNEDVRKKIISHVHAVNKFLPHEYLQNLSNFELICNVHPLERVALEFEIGIRTK
jgi:hypothetical protein